MSHALISGLLTIFKWGSILLCAYAIILACISLFGMMVNLAKSVSGHDKFRLYYLAKTLLGAGVAYLYYYFYYYKGFTVAFFENDTPKAVIILIVCLFLPIALLQASGYLLLIGAPNKKKN